MRPIVIPAEAGIQFFQNLLDSRLRGNDKVGGYLSKVLEQFRKENRVHE
jgi:hypothetical protein